MNTMSRTVAPRAKPAFQPAAAMLTALAHSLSARSLPDQSTGERMNRLMRVVDEQQKPMRSRERLVTNPETAGTAQRGRRMPDASPTDACAPDASPTDAYASDTACRATLAGQPGADGPPVPTPDAPSFVADVRLPYTF